MQDTFLVTIVITTYQRPERILRALSSALEQSCNKEIIIVDDNGKGTAHQIKTEAQLKPYLGQITYLVNDINHGPSYSRNRGLMKAAGKYINFFDDDDEMSSVKLEKQASLLEEKGNDWSCCYCDYKKILGDNKIQKNSESIEGDILPYILGRNLYVGSGSNLLVRTDIAKEVGGYNETMRHFEDYEFNSRLLKNHKMAYLNECLLTIHNEIRDNVQVHKQSYEVLVREDKKYFSIVKPLMDTLDSNVQSKILQISALERWRYSLSRNEMKDAFSYMRSLHVPLGMFIKYLAYCTDRAIHGKCYGFKAF